MSQEVTVYQVRAIDSSGRARIVHSYETEALARSAIETMKAKTRERYVCVPVPNQPDAHWGVNFPPAVKK